MMDSAPLVTPFLLRGRRWGWSDMVIGGGYATPDLRRGGMEHAETSTVETLLLGMQEIALKKLDVKISVISRQCLTLLSRYSSIELYRFKFFFQLVGNM